MEHYARPASRRGRRLARPTCPNCNDMLLAPNASRHVDETTVQHVWSCESCGYLLETSVRFAALQVEAQPAAA